MVINWRQTLTCKSPVLQAELKRVSLGLTSTSQILTLNKLNFSLVFYRLRIQNADGIDAWSHSAKRLSLSAQTVVRRVGFWSLNIRSLCWAMVLLENPGFLQKFIRHKSELIRGDVIVFKQKRWETFWTNLLSDEITAFYLDLCEKVPTAFMH